MKPSIWDILTGVVALAIVCLACSFATIFLNPSVGFNPFPPPTSVPAVAIVIPTATPPAIQRTLPPTWTPTATSVGTSTPAMILRPSSTLPPTATQYILPTGTITPTPTITPGGPTNANLRCYIDDESPKDDTQFSPNQEFDKRWVIRNNSGETWRADILDVRYLSGTKMQTGKDAYDLPRDINNRESFDITIRMRAPSAAGVYKSVWTISTGSENLCNFTVQIIVK